MTRNRVPIEFIFQLAALLLIIIVVHSAYVAWIRPEAQEILQYQAAMANSNPDYVPERSAYVVIKDFEQESCIILMLWAMALMAFKSLATLREWNVFNMNLIQLRPGASILPEDAREYSRPIQALPYRLQRYLLPRALLAALQRFQSTGNLHDTAQAVHAVCDSEANRLDSELSLIRYISWAIPSIGFLGTVRGIGQALSQAHKAALGDISGVTQSLGVAFNSTFVALLISIVVMFLLHQLQQFQERLVIESEEYCTTNLIANLKS
jgi:biopolymer transport protein ExbB/TolQ